MLATLSLALSLMTLALAAGLFILLRRARQARAELARSQHDKALALDRRCDFIQRQIDAMTRRQGIDHLQELVAVCERHGRLDAGVARRLERYVLVLHDEARCLAEAG